MEQVWFAGQHSEVGGAAGHDALRWMAERAAAAGLDFDPPPSAWAAAPPPPVHIGDLASTWWRFACGQATRPIGEPQYGAQRLSPSVEALLDTNEGYRRVNLTRFRAGSPLTAPEGKKWAYTVPGALDFHIRQYEQVKTLNLAPLR